MIDEITQEKLVERLVSRIENLNEELLVDIGRQINKIGGINPTKAYEIGQMIKYGANIDEIALKLAKITRLNVADIYTIFEEEAKINQEFAKKYYLAKDIQYIPYELNEELQRQVRAIAEETAYKYFNLSNTLAFARLDKDGNLFYSSIAQTYQDAIDKAILSIRQGKETYYASMERTIKELAESGIRTVDYASGTSRRLDSAVRLCLNDGLRDMTNKLQEQFGKEFGADGVEISVHEHSAPDHIDIQGKQFSKEEFNKFQNDLTSITYDGKTIYPDKNLKDRRSIGQYNCYHTIFYIVLGVDEPRHNQRELNYYNDKNKKGFDFDGTHYSMYEGTQLQRKIETRIRHLKDGVAISQASGDDILTNKYMRKIALLNKKYKQLSLESGLPQKKSRLKTIN